MQGAELLSVELLIQSVTRLDIEYPAFDEAHNGNMYGDLNFFFFSSRFVHFLPSAPVDVSCESSAIVENDSMAAVARPALKGPNKLPRVCMC